jgi:hypothetical protein
MSVITEQYSLTRMMGGHVDDLIRQWRLTWAYGTRYNSPFYGSEIFREFAARFPRKITFSMTFSLI